MKSTICEYFSCCVAKRTGRDCAKYKNCQTYKFYNKYGTENLGIGTTPRLTGKLEEEILGIGAMINLGKLRMEMEDEI